MEIIAQLNNTDQRAIIVRALDEALRILQQIDQGKSDIKLITAHLKESIGVKPAEFNKILSTIHKDNLDDQKDQLDTLEAIISTIKISPDDSDDEDDDEDRY